MTIIDTMGQGLTVTDAEGRFELVNPAYARFFGYQPEELIGKSPMDITFQDDRETLRRHGEQRRGGETSSYHSRLIRADGSLAEVLVTGSPRYSDGQLVGSIAVITDMTEIRREEHLRHEAEELFNMAFRSSPIGVNIFRLADCKILDANDAYLALTGYSRPELLAKSKEELNIFFDREQNTAWLQTLLRDGRVKNIETRIRTKSGESRSVLFSIEVFSVQDEQLGMMLSFDISDRIQAESALKAAHAGLERRVLERTADLQAANAALEKASKAKDEFMAIMSHELRTPLTGILGLSQVLQYSTSGELNARQISHVQNIEKSGHHLLELINDILDFSKMQAKKLELQSAACSVASICQASVQMVKTLAEKKDLELVLSMPAESIILHADERRLRQVVINLLGNAIKFTPNGGRVELSVLGLPERQQVQISISDTGIGIQECDLPRLFQPFTQLDMRLTRSYEGTGLGLALVRQIAELHGGSVEVESVFGEGSRFSLRLPWDGCTEVNIKARAEI